MTEFDEDLHPVTKRITQELFERADYAYKDGMSFWNQYPALLSIIDGEIKYYESNLKRIVPGFKPSP